MLNQLSFDNYKAFEHGELKIKPFTILLGANSVGKSSIMQLLLLLQQTAQSERYYQSALKLHGGYVNLGEGLNLLREKNKKNTLSLKIDFNDESMARELREYNDDFCKEFVAFSGMVQEINDIEEKTKSTRLKDKLNRLKLNESIDKYFIGYMHTNDITSKIDKKFFYSLVNDTYAFMKNIEPDRLSNKESRSLRFYRYALRRPSGINHFRQLKENKDEYLISFDLINGLVKNLDKNFSIKYNITIHDKILVIKEVSFQNNGVEFLNLNFELKENKYALSKLNSKYIDNRKFSKETFNKVMSVFDNPRTIFSFIKEYQSHVDIDSGDEESVFCRTLQFILTTVNESIHYYFSGNNINYVSPLRAHPKRYYFLDKAKVNTFVDTLDGDAIAEILKEDVALKRQVNTWFKKFNLRVNVEHLEDVIHKLQISQNSLKLDITDVGFGISQVLPVIIQGFLSKENSLTLIEQPEIHLHPKMQAELADLFIDILSNKKKRGAPKCLVIETHSEYLLKRLRRRISEGHISADEVAIYLIDPQDGKKGADMKELEIEEKGHFKWPVDFYGGDLLEDTVEFLKNQ